MSNQTLIKKVTGRILQGLLPFCFLPALIWFLPIMEDNTESLIDKIKNIFD